jgi:hypothetical protein
MENIASTYVTDITAMMLTFFKKVWGSTIKKLYKNYGGHLQSTYNIFV